MESHDHPFHEVIRHINEEENKRAPQDWVRNNSVAVFYVMFLLK